MSFGRFKFTPTRSVFDNYTMYKCTPMCTCSICIVAIKMIMKKDLSSGVFAYFALSRYMKTNIHKQVIIVCVVSPLVNKSNGWP